MFKTLLPMLTLYVNSFDTSAALLKNANKLIYK